MVDLLFPGLLQGLWLPRERGQGLGKGGAPLHPLDSCYAYHPVGRQRLVVDGGGDVCFRRKLGSRWAQSQGEKRAPLLQLNKLELSVC